MATLITKLTLGFTVIAGGLVLWNFGSGRGYVNPEISFDSVKDYSESEGATCDRRYFDLKGGSLAKLRSAEDTEVNGALFVSPKPQRDRASACLAVNWNRFDYRGGHWKGKFKWNWSFLNGDRGLASFNVVDLSGTAGQRTFRGITYALAKEDSQWRVSRKKEVNQAIAVDFRDWIPNIQILLASLGNGARHIPPFWSEEVPESSGLCSAGACDGLPVGKRSFSASWLWRRSPNVRATAVSDAPLTDWSSNFGTWWNRAYSLADWNLPQQLLVFTGQWSNVEMKYEDRAPKG